VAIPPTQFRHTLSHLATGVSVLVAKDAAGQAHGMTMSAVTSLSLEPPMILACVDHRATIHDIAIAADVFAVSVLAAGQEAVAERFADRDRHAWDLDVHETCPAGIPLVDGAIACMQVRRVAVLPGGDHSIITGTVEWSDTREGAPLLYYRSRYTGLAR
jgi:flavin reductase (DIM6/NTAB) family NADH-FMN oxidoreductase RutF